MIGDSSLFRHAKKPYLALLVAAVSGGLILGGGYLGHILKNDPTMMLKNKKETPFPWISVPQNRNLKLFAIEKSQFSNDGARESYL